MWRKNCLRWRDYLTKPQNFEGMRSRWSMEVSRILLTKRDDWQDYIWPDIRSSWTFFRGIGKYDINMLNAYRQHDRLFQNEKINCDYFYLLKFVGRAEFNSVALDSKSIFSSGSICDSAWNSFPIWVNSTKLTLLLFYGLPDGSNASLTKKVSKVKHFWRVLGIQT